MDQDVSNTKKVMRSEAERVGGTTFKALWGLRTDIFSILGGLLSGAFRLECNQKKAGNSKIKD